MWYIITAEPHDFLRLKVQRDESTFKFVEKVEGAPIFDVSEGKKLYSIEMYDDSYEPYYLNEIYKINPKGFTCLNHTTILLQWKDEVEVLKGLLVSLINPKDKFVVFRISDVIASNFLPVDYLNQQLKK